MKDLDVQIKRRFKCGKCKNTSAEVRRFAAAGAGITRFLDWQHNEYITVSCLHCGFTEIYDPRVFQDEGKAMSILDLLFGLD